MRNSIYIMLSLMMGLSGCSSQKKLETRTPFVLGEAIGQQWAAGKEESGFGRTVKIVVKEMSSNEVTFQNLYYRGQSTAVHMEMGDNGMTAVAKFENTGFDKPDIIMHADPKKEVGNKPPKPRKKDEESFPFELKETEAVLSYMENDKVKYVKISGIVEKPARIHPGKTKN